MWHPVVVLPTRINFEAVDGIFLQLVRRNDRGSGIEVTCVIVYSKVNKPNTSSHTTVYYIVDEIWFDLFPDKPTRIRQYNSK